MYWIVDSGSPHRGQASVQRWGRWRKLRLAYLPIHTSWLSQADLDRLLQQLDDHAHVAAAA